MTRFARAKGSKSSNERVPDEATPWHIMKQQLEDHTAMKSSPPVKTKSAKQLLSETNDLYYCDTTGNVNNDWAEFPETENRQLKKQSGNKDSIAAVTPNSKKNKRKSIATPVSHNASVTNSSTDTPTQKSKIQNSQVSAESPALDNGNGKIKIVENLVFNKKNKRKSTGTPVDSSNEITEGSADTLTPKLKKQNSEVFGKKLTPVANGNEEIENVETLVLNKKNKRKSTGTPFDSSNEIARGSTDALTAKLKKQNSEVFRKECAVLPNKNEEKKDVETLVADKRKSEITPTEKSLGVSHENEKEDSKPHKKKKNRSKKHKLAVAEAKKEEAEAKNEEANEKPEKTAEFTKISKRQKRNKKRLIKNEGAAADGEKSEKIVTGGFNLTGNDWSNSVDFGKPERPEKKGDDAVTNGNVRESKKLPFRPNGPGNNAMKRKAPKIRDDKEHKRRKPDVPSVKCVINGIEVEIVKYDGFPVKKEDADELKKLKKQMVMKGIPKSEIDAAMKLERRKAEKALARVKKQVCFHCRKAGHNLSDCPELGQEEALIGICFKCGSTEHTHFQCKVTKKEEFRFASCFICREQGHIAKQCPDNPRGLYPDGGSCKICGDVTHLRKDCPDVAREKEENALTLDTISGNALECHAEEITRTVNDDSKKSEAKVVRF